ncbi:MAG: esterase-like activity of phytase family protein [Pseudomonas sp.]|uniref:esterase-like activity of phytase family protein n=1 Tax=Pseudomonas sp. TaxID=306 RepID=UPI00339AF3A5
MMRWLLAALLLAAPFGAWAQLESLRLLEDRAVDGIAAGNLSGLAWCDGALWALSDREDDRLYRLEAGAISWLAQVERFAAPPAPASGSPWGLRTVNRVNGLFRGGQLDFEGLTCDAAGNRYLASETALGVLRLPRIGEPQWLTLPATLTRQARASGLLLHFNAGFEGLAIDPAGERLWLAAERQRRGLLQLRSEQDRWQCDERCVLLSEGGREQGPAALGGRRQPRDFSALAWFDDKLFTLERLAHTVCRRSVQTGAVERCWSFADTALSETRSYHQPHGTAEALWVDAEGAWIGLDNGGHARADGDVRPFVWRFAAPVAGWGAAL